MVGMQINLPDYVTTAIQWQFMKFFVAKCVYWTK